MLGVTLFGIFLTPVFFYVIDVLGETSCLPPRGESGSSAMVLARLSVIARTSPGSSATSPASCAGRPARRARPSPRPPLELPEHESRSATANANSSSRSEITARCSRSSSSTGRSSRRSSRSSSRWPAGSRCRHAAVAQYPGDHAADGRGLGVLPGRQRQGRRRHRRRADRAAGQRRREHAVHVVAMHQRRHVHAHRHVPPGRRPEHGPGARAEPESLAEPILPDLVKRRGVTVKKKSPSHPDDRQPVLARTARATTST